MINGSIHSIETMALHEGPGIRFAPFFQGCPLRCLYCHNPDTWQFDKGVQLTPEALLSKALRYKKYINHSRGGITCTGGEPLMQPQFLLRFLTLCKQAGFHTAIDTSGVGAGDYDALLSVTDLVLLDIKSPTASGFYALTGLSMDQATPFYTALSTSKCQVWIRHVIVPGLNDTKENIEHLKYFVQRFSNIQRIELLPYHTLGVSKYTVLALPYHLEGTPPLSDEQLAYLQSLL